MRILALTNLFPNPLQPYQGLFNYHQIKQLARWNQVEVIAPILWTCELGQRHPRLDRSRQAEVDGIPVRYPRYYYTPKILRGWYGYFFQRSIQKTFELAVHQFGPQAILATWAYPDGWAAAQLGQRLRLPVAIKVHGSDINRLDRHRGIQRRTQAALRQADAIISVSQAMRDHIIALGVHPDKVHLVPNGIDTTQFQPRPREAARRRLELPNDEKIILFVGNFIACKGIPVLIEAVAQLTRRGLPVTAYLIGDGPERPRILHDIHFHGLPGRVRLLGKMPQTMLPDWFSAADVFALPSFTEGCPNVLLEAIACGTPFVATRVGGIPDIAPLGQGHLIAPGNPRELAIALADLIAFPPARAVSAELRSHQDAAQEMNEILHRLVA
ncbi:MAG: glycosyltransferase [Gemmataceae bacterium]